MNIVKAFDNAFKRAEEKNWDYIYVLVDIHGTIFEPSYYNEEYYKYYPYARYVLQMLSGNPKIKLILWTSTYKVEIDKYIQRMKHDYIKFNYVNENPEVKDTDIQFFGKKLYFNVGIDDKFGFEPETDWKTIYEYLKYFIK